MKGPILVALLLAGPLLAADSGSCACGKNPPPPPPTRELHPYALEPEDMRPYANFTTPYYYHYTKLVEYNGAARDVRTVPASEVDEVRIGFLGPIYQHKDIKLGTAMLNGAQMAIGEANARGGYGGKPFVLKVHNDGAVWGASSNEIVKMVYDDKVWAMLGSISGDSTHIALRVSLRAELPIVNSAATDPTIPETIIPWYFTTLQDDRVQCYTLARHIYTELGLKRIAILRINDRYGRFGVGKFKDASRRLGHPVIIEQKFMPGDTDFRRELRIIRESRVDGILVWADAHEAGGILKQAREAGMKQPVFGGFRTYGDDLLKNAGAAAEGFQFVYPYDPLRSDPAWVDFQKRYEAKYGEKVTAFSALSYDTMNVLLDAICRAGLNRGIIRDALYGITEYDGVTGHMKFDPNAKNIMPLYLGTVGKDGATKFRVATMGKEQENFTTPAGHPYARVGEGGVSFNGPPTGDLKSGELRIGIFGPNADKLAAGIRQDGFKLIAVPAEQNWGKSSTALVDLVYKSDVAGIVATDRASAHLAEQIAVKTFVPLIAISSDKMLTSTNIPWIFRLPPDTPAEDAVRAFVEAAHKGGLNRGAIRNELASGNLIAGKFRFESTGELR
ncbi:MAG: ABC transporter substrate-binding protein [Bryobacteraceae bacterium]|jgi:ABC-type branched-subunit amino acid transport system substrate-binding protein